MARRCEDCGTGMDSGICPNCHEDLHVLTFEASDLAESGISVSPEFMHRVEEQQDAIRARDQRGEA